MRVLIAVLALALAAIGSFAQSSKSSNASVCQIIHLNEICPSTNDGGNNAPERGFPV